MDTRREPTLAQTEDARFVAKLRADPLSVVTSQPLISKYHQNTAPFHQRLVWHGSFPNKICYRFEPCLSGSAFICSVGFLCQIITTPSLPKTNPLDISFPNSFLTIELSWGHTEQRIKEGSYDMRGQVVRFLNPFPAERTSEVRQGTCLRGKFLADALWGDHCSSSWIKPLLIGGCCYALQYFTIKWGGQKTRSRGQIS